MTKTWKRSISMFLALVIVFGLMRMNAFASETEEPQVTEASEIIEMPEVTETSEATEAATEPAQTEEATAPRETEAETLPAETEAPTAPEETQAVVVVAPVLEQISDPAMGDVAEEPV